VARTGTVLYLMGDYMSREIPLEITHLRDRLRRDFTGRLPEVPSGSLEERERNFLSRALAAFATQCLSGCTVDEAASAVVDGSGDSGITVFHPIRITLHSSIITSPVSILG
jgi:hypothetical protein